MFTDRYIRDLKPELKIKDIREGHGFGVRIKPDGTKIFFYRFDSPVTGARRFVTLGQYPEQSLKDAHELHGKLYKAVRAGADPLEVARLEKEASEAAPTVKVLGADYVKRHAEVNKKSWLEDQRILEKEIYPAWGKRKAADITKRDVVLLLDKIVDRGAPGTANNTFKIIRMMFNWACSKSILETSPCDRVDMPAPMNVRDRVLDAAEIKSLWTALSVKTTSMRPAVRQMLKLILLTAQRPGEVSGMHTSEIDGNWWNLPAQRSKNGKAHRVYLTGLAVQLIDEAIAEVKRVRKLPPEAKYSGHIFPCPHTAKVKPIERHALSRALKRNESDDKSTVLGIATFTPHDLRRTAATQMSELRFMDEIIDAVLNHTKTGIIATYNKNKYDAEKQQALEAWERRLTSITTGKDLSNVIPILKAA